MPPAIPATPIELQSRASSLQGPRSSGLAMRQVPTISSSTASADSVHSNVPMLAYRPSVSQDEQDLIHPHAGLLDVDVGIDGHTHDYQRRRSSVFNRIVPARWQAASAPASRGVSLDMDMDGDYRRDAEREKDKDLGVEMVLYRLRGDTDEKGKDTIPVLVMDADADVDAERADILDAVRAQRARTRRRCWTVLAVIFAAMLTTGAIYGAVVEGTWKKYSAVKSNHDCDDMWESRRCGIPYPLLSSLKHKRSSDRPVSTKGMKGDTLIALALAVVVSLITKMSTSSSSNNATADIDTDIRRTDGNGLGINATVLREAGIKRIWAHSHNDEMQASPLSTALSQGIGSIEVDVWLQAPSSGSSSPSASSNSTLYLGHETKDVRPDFTLEAVYLTPLLELLDENNANFTNSSSSSSSGSSAPSMGNTTRSSWVGIYLASLNETVQLVIDIKNAPRDTYARLQAALAPLREKGYLTTYNTQSKEWSYGPLTVIGTGDTPIEAVYHAGSASAVASASASSSSSSSTGTETGVEVPNVRYIFYDAPLLSLSRPYSVPASTFGPAVDNVPWTADVAPMASSKLPIAYNAAGFLPPPPANVVLPSLKWYADQAAARGIRARWWGAAKRPKWLRDRIWMLVMDAGNAWVGADDLGDVRAVVEKYGYQG